MTGQKLKMEDNNVGSFLKQLMVMLQEKLDVLQSQGK
jgi:hypothetical protein